MTGRLRLLSFLLSTTILPILGGIFVMLASTGIMWRCLLPHIYVCPEGATCPSSIDPTTSRYLRLTRLQTIMHYLMELGAGVAAPGLAKLAAYQSWLSMQHAGHNVDTLEHHLGAMFQDTGKSLYILREGTPRLLGAFILLQVTLSKLIQTIVTLSISEVRRTSGTVKLEFSYPSQFSVPTIEAINFTDTRYRTAQRKAGSKVDQWLFSNDSTHGYGAPQFQGTFVIPDNRTAYAVGSWPDGYRINGSVSCSSQFLSFVSNNGIPSITSTNSEYNFTAPLPQPDVRLGAYLVTIRLFSSPLDAVFSSTTSRYLWVSKTNNSIPDSTTLGDNQTYYTLCTHATTMYEISQQEEESKGKQLVRASFPFTPIGETIEQNHTFTNKTESVLFSIGYIIDAWWGTQGNNDWRRISCQQGLLTPLDDTGEACQVSSETWVPTARAMVDAVVQTGNRSGVQKQLIEAHRETIDSMQWWLQAIIPLATFLVYASSLGYTLYLVQPEDSEVKEQSLAEIVNNNAKIFNTANASATKLETDTQAKP